MTQQPFTDPIEIDDDDDPSIVEVEQTEVTEANYQDFLPDYTDTPPGIAELPVNDDGKLTREAQAAWDEDPPDPQDGFEDTDGL